MRTMSRFATVVGMVAVAWAAGGCTPGPFNVKVFVDEADAGLRDEQTKTLKSIQVDLIGVNPSEYEQWEQMSVSEYWEPTNPIRQSAYQYVMKFGDIEPTEQVLSAENKIWNRWIKENQAEHLFVFANLQGIEDKPGDADPRRVILPLARGKWDMSAWGNIDIPIKLRAAGLVPLRQPKK